MASTAELSNNRRVDDAMVILLAGQPPTMVTGTVTVVAEVAFVVTTLVTVVVGMGFWCE